MDIKRDKYLNDLINRMHNGMIKIVTGIRRCGKSYLLFNNYRKRILEYDVIYKSWEKVFQLLYIIEPVVFLAAKSYFLFRFYHIRRRKPRIEDKRVTYQWWILTGRAQLTGAVIECFVTSGTLVPIPHETLFILIIKMTVHSLIQRRHLVSKYMIIPSVVLTESAGSSIITDLKCICQIICVSQAGVVDSHTWSQNHSGK